MLIVSWGMTDLITTLIPTSAQEDLENDSEKWNMFSDEVKEEGNHITDSRKGVKIVLYLRS
jgi:hypothetical protein